MKSREYEMYVANTLQYIHLLPEKERIIELDALINYSQSNDRYRVYDHAHYKLMKKLFQLANKVLN